MKSIRLSLILYVLGLSALVLVGVLRLVFQITHKTLQAKEQTTRDLLRARYDGRCRTLEDEFDDQLVHRAQFLARLAQQQWVPPNPHFRLYSLGLLSAATIPQGYLQMPAWAAEGIDGPFAGYLQAQSMFRIRFAEAVLPPGEEAQTDFFQVYSEHGRTQQRSLSMADRSFELDTKTRDQLGLFDWAFDETELAPGQLVRRVTLKSPVSRFRFEPPPGWRPASRESARRADRSTSPPKFPSGPVDRFSPAVYIQYARDTRQRDQALAGFKEELDRDLAAQEAESRETLVALRDRLWWIGLATFAAVAAGSCWLIGLGLAPLRRLSEAVSRVSAKDFRLPLDAARLPRELRPIAERLVQTLDQLERAFAREKQASADISHELRTPLAALLATIEVGLRRPRTAEKYLELLQDCRVIGQQMSGLVERLLVLARMDAGADTLRLQEVDAAELAGQCVALVRPLAEARGLDLELHCNGPARLNTDPDKLREVLTNLLHNAVEYNRPQGRIEVTVGRENGSLQMEVRDTGIGIGPQARARVFERFFRADGSRQAEGLHAGVGLSIVKGYVDLMGGTVAVDSAEGRGSTFRVELPAT
jgi:heavy metal sensor kinase